MKDRQTYDGDDLFHINNNLYGYDDIDYEQSKADILEAFKDMYEGRIKRALETLGFTLESIHYYSPQQYNYGGDSIDITVGLSSDLSRYNKALGQYEADIDKELEANVSYDGYLALTRKSVRDEIEAEGEAGYTPDTICLGYLIRKQVDFSDWDMTDYLVWAPTCNECGETLEDEEDSVCDECRGLNNTNISV